MTSGFDPTDQGVTWGDMAGAVPGLLAGATDPTRPSAAALDALTTIFRNARDNGDHAREYIQQNVVDPVAPHASAVCGLIEHADRAVRRSALRLLVELDLAGVRLGTRPHLGLRGLLWHSAIHPSTPETLAESVVALAHLHCCEDVRGRLLDDWLRYDGDPASGEVLRTAFEVLLLKSQQEDWWPDERVALSAARELLFDEYGVTDAGPRPGVAEALLARFDPQRAPRTWEWATLREVIPVLVVAATQVDDPSVAGLDALATTLRTLREEGYHTSGALPEYVLSQVFQRTTRVFDLTDHAEPEVRRAALRLLLQLEWASADSTLWQFLWRRVQDPSTAEQLAESVVALACLESRFDRGGEPLYEWLVGRQPVDPDVLERAFDALLSGSTHAVEARKVLRTARDLLREEYG